MQDIERLAAAEKWRMMCSRYTEDVSRYFQKRGSGAALRSLFQGVGRYGDCPLHAAFLESAETFVESFAAGEDGTADFQREAGALLRAILLTPCPPLGHPAGLTLAAAHGQAAPLIPLAETQELQAVAQEYSHLFTRKAPALPIQETIQRAMRKELSRRARML